MNIKQGLEQEYANYVAANTDPYGRAVVLYSEQWAKLMEEALAAGEKLSGQWKFLSHKADKEGITGFMYGCAVQALAKFWVHGEELRLLHNAEYGISEEKAKGGVVNPAILTFEG